MVSEDEQRIYDWMIRQSNKAERLLEENNRDSDYEFLKGYKFFLYNVAEDIKTGAHKR